MASGNEFYSEEDAQEILRIASQSSTSAGMSREELIRAASELGISADSIELAATELKRQRLVQEEERQEKALREEYRKERRSAILGSLGSLAWTAALILGLLFFIRGSGWPFWIFLFWGVPAAKKTGRLFAYKSFDEGFADWKRRRLKTETPNEKTTEDRIQAPQPFSQTPNPQKWGGPSVYGTPQTADELDRYIAGVLGGARTTLWEATQRYQQETGADPQTAQEILRLYGRRHPEAFSN